MVGGCIMPVFQIGKPRYWRDWMFYWCPCEVSYVLFIALFLQSIVTVTFLLCDDSLFLIVQEKLEKHQRPVEPVGEILSCPQMWILLKLLFPVWVRIDMIKCDWFHCLWLWLGNKPSHWEVPRRLMTASHKSIIIMLFLLNTSNTSSNGCGFMPFKRYHINISLKTFISMSLYSLMTKSIHWVWKIRNGWTLSRRQFHTRGELLENNADFKCCC